MYHPPGTPQPSLPHLGSFFLFLFQVHFQTCSRKRHGSQICQLTLILLCEMPNTKLPRKETKAFACVLTSAEIVRCWKKKKFRKKRKEKKHALEERTTKKREVELIRERSKGNTSY